MPHRIPPLNPSTTPSSLLFPADHAPAPKAAAGYSLPFFFFALAVADTELLRDELALLSPNEGGFRRGDARSAGRSFHSRSGRAFWYEEALEGRVGLTLVGARVLGESESVERDEWEGCGGCGVWLDGTEGDNGEGGGGRVVGFACGGRDANIGVVFVVGIAITGFFTELPFDASPPAPSPFP